MSLQVQWVILSQKTRGRAIEEDTHCQSLASMYTCLHEHALIHAHTLTPQSERQRRLSSISLPAKSTGNPSLFQSPPWSFYFCPNLSSQKEFFMQRLVLLSCLWALCSNWNVLCKVWPSFTIAGAWCGTIIVHVNPMDFWVVYLRF